MGKRRILIVLAAITVLFTTCKKDEYYEKWAGSYECERIRSMYANMTNTLRHDTAQNILVDVTARENSILYISEKDAGPYTSIIHHEVKVNSDGSFKNIEGYGPTIEGNFNKDSLNVYYLSYSPGTAITILYKGKKIKNK